jgi:hypothetical protein
MAEQQTIGWSRWGGKKILAPFEKTTINNKKVFNEASLKTRKDNKDRNLASAKQEFAR